MKNKQKSKGLVPRLRFPGVRDAGPWEVKEIEELCEVLNNRRIPISSSDRVPGSYPYYGASGIVDYIDNYIFDERLVLVGEDGAKWGAFEPTAFIAEGKYWVNNHVHVLKPIGVNDTFLTNYFIFLDIGKYVTGNAPPKLTLQKLKAIPIPHPTPPEQQRIADCLSSLDDLISAEGRKLEALRAHKKGLMQQLFPREGDTVPRLRFPGVRDAGPWEVKEIEELCEVLNNRRIPISSSDRVPGSYPYYGASGIVDYIDNYIFDERLVLVGEDGAKWGAFEPTAFIAEGKYWVNNHVHVLKPIGVNDTFLTNYFIFLDIGKYVTGNAPPKLTLQKLKAIPIPHPTPPEQQRIADCLSSLDDLIAAQARKVELLKQHKKGLMQQLFPVMEEVGG